MRRKVPFAVAFALVCGAVAVWLAHRSKPIVAVATPPAALRTVAAAPGSARRAAPVVAPVFRATSTSDVAAEFRALWATGSAAARERAVREVLPALLARDGAQVAALLAAAGDDADRAELLRQIARAWARADLPAAVAWLAALANADRASAADAMIAEVGRDDFAGALQLAGALARGVDDGRAEHLAQIWTEENPGEATAWIAALPPGTERDRLLARVARVRVRHDPAEAARLLAEMSGGPLRDAAIADTLAQLRLYDPARAAAWQQTLAL